MELLTRRGYSYLIDDSDFDTVSQHSWCRAAGGYLHSSINKKHTYLHRWLLQAKRNQQVDHINGNKADNRRSNLRLCSSIENNWNTKSKGKTSKYRGVCRCRNKWQSRIRIGNGTRIWLGVFNTEEEAAEAYRTAEIKYHGEFAYNEELRNK